MKKITLIDKVPNSFKKEQNKTYLAVFIGDEINDYQFLVDKFLRFIELAKTNIKDVIFVTTKKSSLLVEMLAKEIDTKIVIVTLKNFTKGARIEMYKSIIDVSDYVFILSKKEIPIFLEDYAKRKGKPLFEFIYKGGACYA